MTIKRSLFGTATTVRIEKSWFDFQQGQNLYLLYTELASCNASGLTCFSVETYKQSRKRRSSMHLSTLSGVTILLDN